MVDSTGTRSYYLGVLDIDVPRDPEQSDTEYKAKKKETFALIKDLIHQRAMPYQIFDSGNKGFHIYVFHSACWLQPADPTVDHKVWVSGHLKVLYGEQLFNMIDLSNHFIGKGIRPYTVPNPKTGRANELLVSTYDAPFWSWFSHAANVENMKPTIVAAPYHPVEAVPSPPPLRVSQTIERELTGTTILDKLHQMYVGAEIQLKDGDLFLIRNTKWCCFIKGEHKSQKNYIKLIGEHALVQCHSGRCDGKKLFVSENYRPLTDFGDLLNLYCTEENRPTCRVLPRDQEYISKEDIEWCLGDKGFGAVFAPMGLGKTVALEELLKTKNATYRCLWITVRKNQSTYFAHKFDGFSDYQKITGSLYGVTRLVICINSLMRLLLDGNLPKYDLLILDEIESILEAAVSKILSSGRSEQTNVWNILALLCKSSDNVLIMDGIPTKHSIDYFSGLGILKEFRVLEHHRQPDFRVYKCHCDQEQFIKSINSDLDAGKNIVLVTNTKEVQTMIYNQVTVEPKLMINADSTKKIKNTSKKPNEKWNVRFLAYNNAVGAGQSFDLSHFHCIYAVVSPVSCYPQSFYQLICRIRKLKESNVHTLIIHNEAALPLSKEELKLQKLKNIVHFHAHQNQFTPRLSLFNTEKAEHIRLDICETDFKLIRTLSAQKHLQLKHEDDFFLNMLVDYEHEKLLLRDSKQYSEAFFTMIHRNGGVVLPLREDQQNKLKASTQQLKQEARKLALESGVEVNNQFWSNTDNKVPLHLAKVWNHLVDFSDLNTHYRWLRLRNALMDDPARVYEKEFNSINFRGRALSNCMLFGHGVIDAFMGLSRACEFTIDKQTGIFSGTVQVLYLHEREALIHKHCVVIYDQLYNETGNRYVIRRAEKEGVSARNVALAKTIQDVLKQFGINTVYNASKGQRKMIRGQRLVKSSFTICEETQHVRMAISDIEYDTGEKSTITGVEYLLQKSNKYQ